MSDNYLVRVPYVEGHSHTSTWISDFPQIHQHHQDDHAAHHGHHGHPELSQKEKTLDYLRKEMVMLATNKKAVQDKICYRTCFKFLDRDYVDFCLKQKCDQSSFEQAAKALNLLK